jgi:hypothetical protein
MATIPEGAAVFEARLVVGRRYAPGPWRWWRKWGTAPSPLGSASRPTR